MNEQKIIYPYCTNSEEFKEENGEEYEIIKEDYNSSPKCGTKSQVVKKINNNITFSPVEISTKPYFKYCVIPMKEEQKNDNSNNITNSSKKNNSIMPKNQMNGKKQKDALNCDDNENKEKEHKKESKINLFKIGNKNNENKKKERKK